MEFFDSFNNLTITIDGREFDCDSQPDDRHRGSKVRRIFFEPDFEVKEGMIALLSNGKKYEVIEANNWDSYCEAYIIEK